MLVLLLFVLVEWLDGLFDDDWDGMVFVNEVIDVLFMLCFLVKDGMIYEEIVELDV